MEMPTLPSIVFYDSRKEAVPPAPNAQGNRETFAHDFATGMLTHKWNYEQKSWQVYELLPLEDE